METLPKCRICLVANVRMHVVVDKNMHEVYETLTDVPFVKEDSKPTYACFFCYAQLKQCCQLQRKCLDAEKLSTQMTNDETPLANRGQLSNGLTKTRIESINIVDVSEMESIAVKKEFTTDCERLVFVPKEEQQSNDIKLETVEKGYSDADDTALHHSESDVDDVPIIAIKTEVKEEQEVLDKKWEAHDMRNLKLENVEKGYSDADDTTLHHSESDVDDVPIIVIKTGIKEEQEVLEKKWEAHDMRNLKLENVEKGYSDADDTTLHHSESDVDDVPLIGIKTEVKEDQEVVGKKRRAHDTRVTIEGQEQMEMKSSGNSKMGALELCVVCGAWASGRHYGAITCEGCKGFFLRSIRNKQAYQCWGGKNCEVTKNDRTRCQYCRLQKCLACGMKSALIRSKRKPIVDKSKGEQREGMHDKQTANSKFQGLAGKAQDGQEVHSQINPEEEPSDAFGAVSPAPAINFALAGAVAISKENPGAPTAKKTKLDTRRTKLEDIITEEPITKTKSGANSSINNITAPETNCSNNSNKDNIKCKISSKGTDSDDINRQRKVCVREQRYICDICQRSFGYKKGLKQHIRIHTAEKRFKCKLCQSSFNDKGALTIHIRTHTGEKPFKCELCQLSFNVKSVLIRHFRTHTGERPFKCKLCPNSFNDKFALTIHIRTHTGEKPFKCELCQCSFKRKSELTIHTRTHTATNLFKCDICQRSFNDRNVIIRHIRTHTGERPFKCKLCQSNFNDKCALNIHSRIHTGEKPYKCELCQHSFNRKTELTIHTRTHTGEKPFKCELCQRSFARKNALTIHFRIHTGEKLFKCELCQRSFNRNTSLTRHIRTHIGKNPS